jgi:hypothetical protein
MDKTIILPKSEIHTIVNYTILLLIASYHFSFYYFILS